MRSPMRASLPIAQADSASSLSAGMTSLAEYLTTSSPLRTLLLLAEGE